MTADTLTAIIDKATGTLPALSTVALHNWTEPLLHPMLPELIKIVRRSNLYVYVSSNLNILRREDDLLLSGVDKIGVSVSGAAQETYGVYHQGGDIRTVKENMHKLAASKSRTGSNTRLVCIFHRYRDNSADEDLMATYASELGFEFAPIWAFFTPVEKLLASQAPNHRYADIEFNAHDASIAARLAIPVLHRLELARAHRSEPCIPLNEQLPIGVNGEVQLCCASGFSADTRIGNFLDMDVEEIQRRRESHYLCTDCVNCGIPNYYHGLGAQLDAIGQSNRIDWAERNGKGRRLG